MADKIRTGGGQSESDQPRLAHDGYQPMPGKEETPTKVQGGYQAPPGGAKPATPTTGSGVTRRPAPNGGK